VVAKPTKRPTKRKLEPTTDKVMRETAPREGVKRVRSAEPSGAPAKDAPVDEEGEALSGTRARRAAQAEKIEAETGKLSRRRRRRGRVTEKGTAPVASARYTPPSTHDDQLPSPLWVPVLMFTMFGLGMLTIFLNYVKIVPGGETSNWYLLLGLGFILAGIITATQYR